MSGLENVHLPDPISISVLSLLSKLPNYSLIALLLWVNANQIILFKHFVIPLTVHGKMTNKLAISVIMRTQSTKETHGLCNPVLCQRFLVEHRPHLRHGKQVWLSKQSAGNHGIKEAFKTDKGFVRLPRFKELGMLEKKNCKSLRLAHWGEGERHRRMK